MAGVNDIGIDLGSSHVLIYMKGKGIILREASVVAIDRDSREIIAFGEEASRMIGRTPGNILALRPLRDGSITDYELVSFMLKGFVMKAVGKLPGCSPPPDDCRRAIHDAHTAIP